MRTSYFAKNFLSRIFIFFLNSVLNFATRTVFLWCLSEQYAGIGGVFNSLVSVLSLAELGIGSSIVFAMYKPAANNDVEKMKTLMDFYRRAYRMVGCLFVVVGLGLMPTLPYLAKDMSIPVDLRIVYLFYIATTSFSYWFYAYRASILIPMQKDYLLTGLRVGLAVFGAVARIAVLLLLRRTPEISYYVYSSLGLIEAVVTNLLVKRLTDREYPFLNDRNILPLPKEERKGILKNVVGMTTNRLCQVLNDGIDTVVIASLVSLGVSGIYSNYLTLKNTVGKMMYMVFSSMTASIGNFCAVESRERKLEFLYVLDFLCFWLYGFCSICLYCLVNPFILNIWLHDSKWLISKGSVFLLVFNFLIEGLASAMVKYRDVHGLFWRTRHRYILSSVCNAALSLLLTGPLNMGITGALLGTTISLVIMLSFDPVIVYSEVFEKSAGEYYRQYFVNLAIVLATGFVTSQICDLFPWTVAGFGLRLCVCLVLPNALWLLIFHKSSRFRYCIDTMKRILATFRFEKKHTTETGSEEEIGE